MSTSPLESIAALVRQIIPERAAALGLHPGLDPDGHELASSLLRPLADGRGPVTPAMIAAGVPDPATLDAVLHHRVSLLHGFEEQDLGTPIDWFRAPEGDMQWTSHLHYQYWIEPLAYAWYATQDPRYSGALIDILLDWIRNFPLGVKTLKWGDPNALSPEVPATAEGNFMTYHGPWISLAAHARADHWTVYLQLLTDAPQMTNANAAILLSSLLGDHRLMMLNFDRWATSNQYVAIANSLLHLAWWFPDFVSAAHSETVGRERILRYANVHVYPDGGSAECSPNYATGSLNRLRLLIAEAEQLGRPFPAEFQERVRLGMRYFMLTADPSGNTPRIAKGGGTVRGFVGQTNELFHDPEAAWFTNPSEGKPPETLCQLFPWVGHAVLRSGWDAQATWLFFEPGPRGAGHYDLARLNVQLKANGEWLLTDPGYYSYSNAGDEARMAYFLKSTAAHNLALVDGQGQISRAPQATSNGPNDTPGDYTWTETPESVSVGGVYTFGFTSASDPGYGVWDRQGEIVEVIHRREILFSKRGDAIEITDCFEGTGRHRIDLHWQCDPKAKVSTGPNTATISMPCTRLRMDFEALSAVETGVHRGEKEPYRGWFSETYGALETAPILRVTTEAELPLKIVTRLSISRLGTPAGAGR